MIYKTLESIFAEWTGYNYAIAVNSGTSALHLALLAMGVGKGDEVIVPDLTFVACAFAVSYCGATPVFVDVGEDYNIDPELIEEKITPKTKVIMAVNLYGRRCKMKRIREIADKHKLLILEDMSEAHGIQPTGDIAIYSFQSSKIIHAEEGGLILTNNKQWSDDCKTRKTLSNDGTYYHDRLGFNYRMPDKQAELALKSLRGLFKELKRRRKVEQLYLKVFGKEYETAELPRDVVWVFDFLANSEKERDRIIKQNKGARCFFKPMSSLPMYKSKTGKNALRFSKLGIVLPIK